MTAPTRFEIDFAEHRAAVDDVLLAAHGQMYWLLRAAGDRGYPAFDAPMEDAIKRFGTPPNAPLDLWMMCKALDRLSRNWTGKAFELAVATAPVPIPPVPDPPTPETSDDPVPPDEAVGKPPNGLDEMTGQQRLTGT